MKKTKSKKNREKVPFKCAFRNSGARSATSKGYLNFYSWCGEATDTDCGHQSEGASRWTGSILKNNLQRFFVRKLNAI